MPRSLEKPSFLLPIPSCPLGRTAPLEHLSNFGLTKTPRKRSPFSEAKNGIDEKIETVVTARPPLPQFCPSWDHESL
jgi:hypothetical protein